ncbi:MAG TPA: hypothetical protein VMZ25_00860 [Terriglobales bacterium]|nr:hypothetical protein [Terriglobales bacterium]
MALAIRDTTAFRLLARLRWQVFRNSLRPGFKRVEVLIRGFTWVAGVSTVAITSLIFAANGYFLFDKRPYVIHVSLWVIALVWQILPLVLEGSTPALDFNELARYPLRFRLFYTMSLTYGLLDPAALTCVAWLLCLALGIVMGHPAAIPSVVIFFPLFALLNLLFNRVLFGWLRQVTATRRRREILVAVGVLFLLTVQVSFWTWMPRLEKSERKAQVLPVIQAADRFSPMGVTANAVSAPRESALVALGTLGGGCLLLGFLLYRQLRPIYLGETDSDSEVRLGAIQAEPGWGLPFLGPQLSAMVEREVRYYFSEHRLWVNQVSIWSFVLIGALAPSFFQRAFGWSGERRGEVLYPVAISYSLIVMATLAYNCFWSDAGGYYRWLLSPVKIRRVLQAKNIFFGIAVLVNLVVVTTIVSFGIPIAPLRLLNGVLTTMLIALGVVSAGNLLSGWFPKKVKSGTFSAKNASEAATFIGLIVLAAFSALAFGANWAGKHWQRPWLTPLLLLVTVLAAGGIYLLALKLASEYLEKHQDKMCDELV